MPSHGPPPGLRGWQQGLRPDHGGGGGVGGGPQTDLARFAQAAAGEALARAKELKRGEWAAEERATAELRALQVEAAREADERTRLDAARKKKEAVRW
jgi:hypothetical protein